MAGFQPHIDFTVEVFVVYDNKVLLRKHDKYGIWLSVGGHIELGEDPNEAAIREVKEEVGLEVQLYHGGDYPLTEQEGYKELIPPHFMNRHFIHFNHEHVTMVYFARAETEELVLSETEKSSGCRWFSEEELDEPKYRLTDVLKLYARTALEKCDRAA